MCYTRQMDADTCEGGESDQTSLGKIWNISKCLAKILVNPFPPLDCGILLNQVVSPWFCISGPAGSFAKNQLLVRTDLDLSYETIFKGVATRYTFQSPANSASFGCVENSASNWCVKVSRCDPNHLCPSCSHMFPPSVTLCTRFLSFPEILLFYRHNIDESHCIAKSHCISSTSFLSGVLSHGVGCTKCTKSDEPLGIHFNWQNM